MNPDLPIRRMDHILPSNATEWERNLASQVERLLGMSIPIEDLWNPHKCPVEFLPYLAWSVSADVWSTDWPEHRKRSVIADSLKLHGIKGTLASYEEHAKMVDSEVLRAVTPPGSFFLSAGLSPEERERLMLVMPQIRIYRNAIRSYAGKRMFLSGGRRGTLGSRFIVHSNAHLRSKPRIVFAENNVEREIAVEEVVGIIPNVGRSLYERALLQRPRRKGVMYLGTRSANWSFWTTLDHNRSVATFRRVSGSPSILRYGMQPVSIDPEPFFVQAKGGRTFFLGQQPRKRFLGRTDANNRIYERIVIWDPDLVPRRRGASHFGVSRFGVSPFSAELTVSIPGKRPKRAFGIQNGYLGQFFVVSDQKKYHETFRALRAARATRDKVLINTTTYRPPSAGQLIVAGTPMIAGRLLRS